MSSPVHLHQAPLKELMKEVHADPSSPFYHQRQVSSQSPSNSPENIPSSSRNARHGNSEEAPPSYYDFPNDPIQRCSSPDTLFECDGWCMNKLNYSVQQSQVVR